jgi:acetyl-CoA carboxylase biotin carboxyl carrier protein
MSRNSKGDTGPAQDAGASRSERNQIVDLDFLRGLIAALDDSGIDSLEISRGGTRIRVAKTPNIAPSAPGHAQAPAAAAPAAAVGLSSAAPPAEAAPAAAPAASNLVDVTSPMVGTFYRAPSPEAPSYVEVGSRIVKGQTLCILEAMKLMNELESEVQGVVREICVENSEPVEYGQVLFRIEPSA